MQKIILLDLVGVNAYLVKIDNEFILIDTGGYTFNDKPLNNRWNILEKKLLENDCHPGNLKFVILTHGDIDHIANCKLIKDKYGAKIAIHKYDVSLLNDLTIDKIFSNFKFQSIILKLVSKLMNPMFVKISKNIIKHYNEFEVDYIIDENFDLNTFGLNAELLHLPGHTKGSIGLLFKTGDLIIGDTLSNTNKPNIAMNAFNFQTLKKSVMSLKHKNIQKVYPGHGSPFSFTDLKSKYYA